MINGQKLDKVPVLETARLILREIRPDDLEAIYAYASLPEVARYVSWEQHQSLDDSRVFLNAVLEGWYAQGKFLHWAIEDKESKRMIGSIGLHERAPHNACYEIGYVLHSDFWNKGLVSEAVGAVFKYAFEVLEMNRIHALHGTDNLASEKVMLKNGMVYEGLLKAYFYRPAFGEYMDVKLYRLLKDEYNAAKK